MTVFKILSGPGTFSLMEIFSGDDGKFKAKASLPTRFRLQGSALSRVITTLSLSGKEDHCQDSAWQGAVAAICQNRQKAAVRSQKRLAGVSAFTA